MVGDARGGLDRRRPGRPRRGRAARAGDRGEAGAARLPGRSGDRDGRLVQPRRVPPFGRLARRAQARGGLPVPRVLLRAGHRAQRDDPAAVRRPARLPRADRGRARAAAAGGVGGAQARARARARERASRGPRGAQGSRSAERQGVRGDVLGLAHRGHRRRRAHPPRATGGGGARGDRLRDRTRRSAAHRGRAGPRARLRGAVRAGHRRDRPVEPGLDLRGPLAGGGPAAAGVRRAVPHAVVRGDRQRGDAVAGAGGPAGERAVRVRHAREPGGGEAGLREADPARADARPGGAVAVTQAAQWKRAALVGPALEDLLRRTDAAARLRGDPVELVHRYTDPLDVEVAGLLCAALAYGRVDLFKPRLAALLRALGPSPGATARDAAPSELLRRCADFAYRMTGPRDVACLLYGAGG